MQKIVLSLIVAIFVTGCGTSGTKTKSADGTVTEQSADVAVAEQAAKAAVACENIMASIAMQDSHAQLVYAMNGGPCPKIAKAFYDKQKEKTRQVGQTVRSVASWAGGVYLGGKLLDAGAELAKAAGNTYNTNVRDVNVSAGAGGAGGEGAGGAGGAASVNLGGLQATEGSTLIGHDAPFFLRDSTFQGNEKGNIGDGDLNDNDNVQVDDVGVI